jgi:hypothetical protein
MLLKMADGSADRRRPSGFQDEIIATCSKAEDAEPAAPWRRYFRLQYRQAERDSGFQRHGDRLAAHRRLTFTEAIASYNADHVISFITRVTFRLNDPSTAIRAREQRALTRLSL